jgi:hypothetical protein
MVLRLPSCSPRRAKPVSRRRHRHWVSGPHDFSVRAGTVRLSVPSASHRIPRPTSVTIAIRPSCESGMDVGIDRVAVSENQNIFVKGAGQVEIHRRSDLPVGQISLKPKDNLFFERQTGMAAIPFRSRPEIPSPGYCGERAKTRGPRDRDPTGYLPAMNRRFRYRNCVNEVRRDSEEIRSKPR